MKSIHQLDARTARAQKIRHFLYMIVFVVVFSIALSLYSQVRYHRSAAATVAEFDLRLLLASQDQNELTKKLTGMLEEGKTTYEIPSYILFDSELEIRRHEYGESSMQVFHLLPSPEVKPGSSDTVIYYLHGGSYMDEPNPFHWETLDQLCQETGYEVIVPDYPMIPFDDAESSYPLVYTHYTHLIDENPKRRVILMGDSAGGGYCLGLVAFLEGLAYLPEQSQSYELFTPKTRPAYLPDQLILLSPWVDVTMDNPEIADYIDNDPMLKKDQLELCGLLWAGSRPPADPLISPLYAFEGTAGTDDRLMASQRILSRNFPKTLIFTGTREIFYPDIMELYRCLDSIGCDVTLSVGEGMNHVWVVYPIPEGEEAVQQIESFIQEDQ